jgi:hypothetical protein
MHPTRPAGVEGIYSAVRASVGGGGGEAEMVRQAAATQFGTGQTLAADGDMPSVIARILGQQMPDTRLRPGLLARRVQPV